MKYLTHLCAKQHLLNLTLLDDSRLSCELEALPRTESIAMAA